MTLYRVSIGKNEYHVEVSDSLLRLNGEQIQAMLIPINQAGLYLLKEGKNKLELFLNPQGRSAIAASANGRHVIAQVEKDTGRARPQAEKRNEGDLVAPMPGLVVNILVSDGDLVQTGQVLVVLESMKMQMELRSPIAGRVAKVAVSKQAQVEKGALLVQVVGQ